MIWRYESYPSGTMVVLSDDVSLPYYHIGYAAAPHADSEHIRYDVAQALEDWLNGGGYPECLVGVVQMTDGLEARVTLTNTVDILVAGPICPHGHVYDSFELSARVELIEAIRLRRRPVLHRVPNPDIGTGEET